jgi:hypothetical protein
LAPTVEEIVDRFIKEEIEPKSKRATVALYRNLLRSILDQRSANDERVT